MDDRHAAPRPSSLGSAKPATTWPLTTPASAALIAGAALVARRAASERPMPTMVALNLLYELDLFLGQALAEAAPTCPLGVDERRSLARIDEARRRWSMDRRAASAPPRRADPGACAARAIFLAEAAEVYAMIGGRIGRMATEPPRRAA